MTKKIGVIIVAAAALIGIALTTLSIVSKQKPNEIQTEPFADYVMYDITTGGTYTVKDGHIYYENSRLYQPVVVSGADPKTFSVIDKEFAKDAFQIYFGGSIIEGADLNSFEIIVSRSDILSDVSPSFSRDASSVFIDKTKISGADPETFKILENEDYQTDKNTVYYRGIRMEGVDPSTFQFWDGTPYAKDRMYAYYAGKTAIENADVSTFEALTNYKSYSLWAKDSRSVYWGGLPIPDADAATFELYWTPGLSYGKDSMYVYRQGKIVEGADPKTFQP